MAPSLPGRSLRAARGPSAYWTREVRTVKRTVILAAGAVALGAAACVGALWAQTGARPATPPAAAEPRTRVAIINLAYVIKHYAKFEAFQAEIKGAANPYQAKEASYRTEAEGLAKQNADPKTTQEKREANEKRLRELQRLAEDNKADGQKTLAKKQEDQLKILYLDVRSVVERYAQSHNFEMVLHYNDAIKPEDYWGAQNIASKIQQRSLMPMYSAPGMDISQEIVKTLNAAYKPTTPPPVGGNPATRR
jgi:Skp family chaperone for outer membrane proteins